MTCTMQYLLKNIVVAVQPKLLLVLSKIVHNSSVAQYTI